MNTVTRAHFHLRIVQLIKNAPTHKGIPVGDPWASAVTELLRELSPLLEPSTEPVHPAVTLRDKAAIAAMQALIATPLSEWPADPATGVTHASGVSAQAVFMADQLIAALNKEKPQ